MRSVEPSARLCGDLWGWILERGWISSSFRNTGSRGLKCDSKKRWKSGGRWFSSFRAFYSFSFIFIQRYRNIVVYFMHVYMHVSETKYNFQSTIVRRNNYILRRKKSYFDRVKKFRTKSVKRTNVDFFFFFLYQRINFSRESIAARVSCVANCYCIKVRMKQKFGYYLCLWTRD